MTSVVSDEEFEGVLRRTRQLDPTCEAEGVRRFMHEIAEAKQALEHVDLNEADPLPVTYSPNWSEG